MTRQTISAVAILALVAGCGSIRDSRVNPMNWFGKDRSAKVEPVTNEAADLRPQIDQVVSLRAEQVAGGAIVHAVGLPQTQGFYEAELVEIPTDEAGILDLGFRILPPQTPTRQGSQASREVIVAKFLSNQDLAGVTRIRVQGARNARIVLCGQGDFAIAQPNSILPKDLGTPAVQGWQITHTSRNCIQFRRIG